MRNLTNEPAVFGSGPVRVQATALRARSGLRMMPQNMGGVLMKGFGPAPLMALARFGSMALSTLGLATGLSAGLAIGAAAQTPPPAFDAAAAFGAREGVGDVSLSPDGKLIAMVVAMPGGASRVEVAPVAGGTPAGLLNAKAGQRITGCSWSGAARLVCGVFMANADTGLLLGFTRMFAVDADGKNLRELTGPQSSRALGVIQNGGGIVDLLPDENAGAILLTRTLIPENTMGTRMAETRQGLALERIDTDDLKRRYVEQPRERAVQFITDGHGQVRVIGERPAGRLGYDEQVINYCYRQPGKSDCTPLSKRTDDGAGFDPYAVDRDLNVVYGFDAKDGRQALYKIALDGTMKRDLVLADPRVDVDGLIRIGRQRRVVGASFATERRENVIFDPALAKLARSLAKALPKLPNIAFVDASTDESRLVLVASSDNDPGRYYVYDKPTHELNELVSVRPALANVTLATVKPITFAAADGTSVPGYLTLPPGSDGKNIPAIVMPHGGPGARDEWGFDWWAQYFANRGFAVLQPNFRGSTGYGESWFKQNGFKSWRTAIGDVNDAGRWLLKQGIAAPGKLAIVGWSYGGYAALQSSVLDPELFKAIVAVAPVTDLEQLRQESSRYANYASVSAFIGQGPHIREGSPAQNSARIKAPVLMFHGDRDQNVGIGESRLMETRLKADGKTVTLVTYPGLDHQLDDSTARTDMLRRSDAFLRTSLGL